MLYSNIQEEKWELYSSRIIDLDVEYKACVIH